MKMINHCMTLLTTLVLSFYVQTVLAIEVTRPNFVKNVSSNALQDAGNEIYIWVSAAFMVVLMLSCVRPAWFFVNGEKEKAMDHAKDIMYGALMGVFFAGVVFAVMEAVA